MDELIKGMDEAQLRAFFDIDGTVSWVKLHGYSRIALQFPDYFLCFSANVAALLESDCDGKAKTFILADTTYRSCCVDMVAAEQCSAHCIVHYGDSCMTETNKRLPIRFVYGNMPIDWEQLEQALKQYSDKFEQKCYLLYDTVYANSSDGLLSTAEKFITADNLFHCKFVDRCCGLTPNTSDVECCLGRRLPKEKCNVTVLFIGEGSSPLLPLWLMSNLNCVSVFAFSPTTFLTSFTESFATTHLRRRLFLIEKLCDARTVGLIVNTLDAVGYEKAVERTRKLCTLAGKKSYTLAVGKINEPKLANFANDIEVFIVLSCPYGVILDVSDFYRPVVSLFEAEVALNPNHIWSASEGWTAEFRNFLQNEIGKTAEGHTDVSLVTGRIRSMGTDDGDTIKNSCSALSAYSVGDYFSGRTWKGLDESYKDESTAVQEGRSGIASHYKSELSR